MPVAKIFAVPAVLTCLFLALQWTSPGLPLGVPVLATYTLLFYLFVRNAPLHAALLSYILILAFTAFLAAFGIEEGGYLTEIGLAGDISGAPARLLLFYVVFLATFAISFRLKKKTIASLAHPYLSSNRRQLVLGVTISGILILCGIAAGLLEGFAFIQGVNRYAVRNFASPLGQELFNAYLNNRIFITIVLGIVYLSDRASTKLMATALLSISIGVSVLHGEQFMATVQMCLAVLIPIVAVDGARGRFDLKIVAIASAVAVAIGTVSVYFAYLAQDYDVLETFGARVLLQGQLWFAVDRDSSLFDAPPTGGWSALSFVVNSLGNWNSPQYISGEVSGLRHVMAVYGLPDVYDRFQENNITFSMGQMAVPTFWFGHAGGLLFVALSAACVAFISALLIRAIASGGVVALWLATKSFNAASFALQQGEYWSLFGVRTLLYVLATYIALSLIPLSRGTLTQKRPILRVQKHV